VGGPNIWEKKESFWQAIAGSIMESFFAHFLMAARYRPIGPPHRSSEKELVLCNLAIPRDVFLALGGFQELLYPNEENELLNRIEKAGFQLLYHPAMTVARPRRQNLKEIILAFFFYGRGRMEQIRIEGIAKSLILLIPAIFIIYLLFLPFYHPWFGFLPLVIYFVMAFSSALGCATRKKKYYLVVILPWVFLGVHLIYALGLLAGLATNFAKKSQKNRQQAVKIEKIKKFAE